MSIYSLSHLSDHILLSDLATLVAQDRKITAALLAHLAEVDERSLYLPAAYPSMYAYCVGELRLSEQAALKRIRAARAARQFPGIFDAVADGRLHLSAIVLLAPYLTPENANELLAAATHKNKSQIEQLLAQRFPRPDAPTLLQPITPVPTDQLSPGTVGASPEQRDLGCAEQQPAPGPAGIPTPRARVAPLAPQRFALQLTMSQSTHDKLRYAQELLSHQIPSGDVVEVLDRALDALIRQLEKRKFAATEKPRPSRQGGSTVGGRYIPAEVKRAVWKRDRGQCTFVSETGQRCPARKFLEFDHMDEVARGGEASVERIRLRCRAHNQYSAECTFGTEFMNDKRQAARRAAAEARAKAAAAAERAQEQDVIPWLRRLGFRADEARRAAALCETIHTDSLEERVRVALSFLGSRGVRRAANGLGTAA